uniref:7TM_GPCR_Srx domain-containing protein n=1 Tax=Steinernema glaseri TaxID=37863 RepID=A0A1I8AUR9_9BILA
MLHIGVADCIQLVIHLYAGIATICEFKETTYFEKFSGAILNSNWIIMNFLILVLAVNRVQVLGEFSIISFWKPKLFYNALAAICWCAGMCFCVAYLTPLVSMEYHDSDYYWSLEGDKEVVAILTEVEIGCTMTCLLTTFCIYVFICAILLVKGSVFLRNTRNVPKHELRVLAQAVIMFSYTMFLTVCWHWGQHFLPNSFWTPVAINILWILDNGALSPILYLIVNRSIRRKFIPWCRQGQTVRVFYFVGGNKFAVTKIRLS